MAKNEMEHTLIVRLHRAPHDSAQNEAERTNAAIGEALTTGRPVEPPADPFYGLYGLTNGQHDTERG